MTDTTDFFEQLRASIREVSPADADRLRQAGASLLDVREPIEWDAGHIPGAMHLPRGQLAERVESLLPGHDRPIVVYCATGIRSAFATQALGELGYTDVVNLAGGIEAWRRLGLPVDAPATLSPAQQERYSRHLVIPEVGPAGQARLLDSKVLIVGAGGLGSPAALYLAAAGVGTIGIVDFDVVETSNLQRQILHSSNRVGERKTESARQAITALNPDVAVVKLDGVLAADNVERLIDGYDVVLDGTDTFETRYLLNDAAVAAGTPVAHASVFRFEGQLTTFVPYEGPCYRCLYPTPPPPELAPGCSVAGVLGVVPGIMGLLQANEVLKVLLGIGEPLVGRLLLFDALDGSFSELKLARDPACPVCSDEARAARDRGERVTAPVHAEDGPFALRAFGSVGLGAAAGATPIGQVSPTR